jgi:RHS repeat-associated protein
MNRRPIQSRPSLLATIACLTALGACGRKDKGAEVPEFAMYSGALTSTGITVNRSGYAGHLCITGIPDECDLSGPINLSPGQHSFYTYGSYAADATWNPTLVTLTVEADGNVILPANPYMSANGNTIILQTKPLTLAAPGLSSSGYFTFDWSAPPITFPRPDGSYEYTSTLLVARRYSLNQVDGMNIDPAAPTWQVGGAGDILINPTAAVTDIAAGTLGSFSWDPLARKLTAKIKTVTIDFQGYHGNIGFSGMYQGGPGEKKVKLLYNRRYRPFDYSSIDAVALNYYLSSTYDLVIDGNGTITLGTESSRHLTLDPTPNPDPTAATVVAKIGTIEATQWDGYWYQPGIEIGASGSTSTPHPKANALRGRLYRRYPYSEVNFFALTDAGLCHHSNPPGTVSSTPAASIIFANSGGGTVTAVCGLPPPPAPVLMPPTPLAGSSIRIEWIDPNSAPLGYEVQRSETGAPADPWAKFIVTGAVKTFTDTGLLPSKPYFYRVGTVTMAGSSPTVFSTVLSALTLAACLHDPPGTLCGGAVCTSPLFCSAGGACNVPGSPPACDDGDPCTVDTCDAAAPGFCRKTLEMVGKICGNPIGCNAGASCGTSTNGVFGCVPPPTAPSCNDNNTCTLDACPANTGICSHLPDPAANTSTCGPTTPPGYDTPPPQAPLAAEPAHGAEFNGALAGKLSVGPSGAAIYTVPISIPPGIAGMAPNLSLVYNSQGGNGIAGQGMELSGLSMIHRCPKNRVQDGETQAVRLARQQRHPSGHDAVCIDGQRLLETNVWGVYKTELADFATVTDLGNLDSNGEANHLGFRVVTKSGETRYYGDRPNARVEVAADSVNFCPTDPTGCKGGAAIWLLDRVEDAAGNYFEFQYNDGVGHIEDVTGTSTFLNQGIKVTSIAYTGNLRATTYPFNQVNFTYEPRQDVRHTRIGSLSLPRADRLKTISTAANGTPVATYALTYEAPDPDHMLPSQLSRISYCTGQNGSGPCMKDLVFGWTGGGYGWRSAPDYALPASARLDRPDQDQGKAFSNQFVDLDGDGRPEFFNSDGAHPYSSNQNNVWKNTGTGFVQAPLSWTPPGNLTTTDLKPRHAVFVDFDNDGSLDFLSSSLTPATGPNIWLNRIASGGGWVQHYHPVGPAVGWGNLDLEDQQRYGIADMNGDGRPDLVVFGAPESTSVNVVLNTVSGWQRSTENFNFEASPNQMGTVADCYLRDINRDGVTDAICRGKGYLNATGNRYRPGGIDGSPPDTVWLADGLDTTNEARMPPSARYFGDIDGDGQYDVVTIPPLNHSINTPDPPPPFTQPVYKGSWFAEMPGRSVRVSTASGYMDAAPGYMAALNSHMVNWTPPGGVQGRFAALQSGDGAVRYAHLFALADFNADGLADFVFGKDYLPAEPAPSFIGQGGQMLVNTGLTWAVPRVATPVVPDVPGDPYPGSNRVGVAYVDLNGDGVTDVIRAAGLPGGNFAASQAWINEFRPPVIETFPAGLPRASEVEYAFISTAESAAVYTDVEDPATRDPRLVALSEVGKTRLMAPVRVVKSVMAEDGSGLGGRGVTTYKYLSLRGSSTGRGPQGFFRVISHESLSDITTTTTYAQAFPYSGQVTSVLRKKEGSGGGVLAFTSTSYCDKVPDTGCTPLDGPADGGAYSPSQTPPDQFGATSTVPIFVYPNRVDHRSFVRSTPTTENPLGGVDNVDTTTTSKHDGYGNLLVSTVTIAGDGGGQTRQTSNTYGIPGSIEERMGKVTRSVVNSSGGGLPPITRTTTFAYTETNSQTFPPNALKVALLSLATQTVEPGGGPTIEMRTVYDYDLFGNVTTTTACQRDFDHCVPGAQDPPGTSDPSFRTTRVSYDPADYHPPAGLPMTELPYANGQFPVRTINALGHTSYVAYHRFFGGVVQQTDANGITTCSQYDEFGRKRVELARCGTSNELTTLIDHYVSSATPAVYAVTTVTRPPVGSPIWTHTDVFGRVRSTLTGSFDGSLVETTKTYDTLGRVSTETKPRIQRAGEPTYSTETTYDSLSRVDTVTTDLGTPGNGPVVQDLVTMIYNIDSVTSKHTVAGTTQTRTETKNLFGKTASVTDSDGVSISYKYDADGNLTDTTDPSGNIVHIEYDARGRKKLSNDPDMGQWSYTYNGFGDLITQADAKGQVTTMTYDQLGRMRTRSDAGGKAEWIYDVAGGAGIGKLAALVSAPDSRLSGPCTIQHATLTDGNRTGRWLAYTATGDVDTVSECADGATFATNYTYDQFGRQSSVLYPAVAGSRLTVKYNYTAAGYLSYVSDAADGKVYWAAKSMNAAGQVTSEYTRNGVETTSIRNGATGWLQSTTTIAHADADKKLQELTFHYDQAGNLRFRSNTGVTAETFGYDSLNRLTSAQGMSPGIPYSESYAYDPIGNVTSKAAKIYTYGTCGAGPHAVCTVDGGPAFTYDPNGNMVASNGRTVSYNVQNKPVHMSGNGAEIAFMYGADGNRVVQAVTGGSASGRTIYVGLGETGKSLYERTTRGSTTEHVQFIYAASHHGGNAFALKVVTETSGSPSTSTVKYNHFDHLGSVTAVSDQSGPLSGAATGGANAGVLSYDAWGARRDPGGGVTSTPFVLESGHREFTGHETIPDVGLVNMNGRVYDPALGRFLTPDPHIQFLANLQSYNRYSYVVNNPLSLTDPTGYFAGAPVWLDYAVNGTLLVIGVAFPVCAPAAFYVSLVWNAASAISNGASVEQVIVTTAIGLASANIGSSLGSALTSNSAVAQLIGGAVGGAVGAAWSTMYYGGNLGENMLRGAATGALSAAVTVGVQKIASVSQASAAEAQGGKYLTPDAEKGRGWFKLSDEGRAKFKDRFAELGYDVERTRVHVGDSDLNAGGYHRTFGDSVYLVGDAWQRLNDDEQLFTLAHEMTHSVQWDRGASTFGSRYLYEEVRYGAYDQYNVPSSLSHLSSLSGFDVRSTGFTLDEIADSIAHSIAPNVTNLAVIKPQSAYGF